MKRIGTTETFGDIRIRKTGKSGWQIEVFVDNKWTLKGWTTTEKDALRIVKEAI